MAPKGKVNKSKRNSAAGSAAADSAPIYGTCDANFQNLSKHQMQVTQDLALIVGQDGFSDILSRTGASAAQANFDATMFDAAMGVNGPGLYRCGGNGLWASVMSGPVAPTKSKIDEIITWRFGQPSTVFRKRW